MRNVFWLISFVILVVSCNTVTEEKRENYDFGSKRFDEPFYYLPSKPEFLVQSLEYTPSWFLTDTIYLTKTIEIEFNEESIRSQSKALIKVGDSLGNPIPGVEVYFNSRQASDNLIELIELMAIGEDKQEIVIGLKLLPEYGEQNFKGGIFLLSDDIDELNGAAANYDQNQFAEWTASQKIGGTWLLWLVWFLLFLLLIFVLYNIIYLLISSLPGVKSIISSVPYNSNKPKRLTNDVKNKKSKVNKAKKKAHKEDYFKDIREAVGSQKGANHKGKKEYRNLDHKIYEHNNKIYYDKEQIGFITLSTIVFTQDAKNIGVSKILNHPKLMSKKTYVFYDGNVTNTVETDKQGRIAIYKAIIKNPISGQGRNSSIQTDALIFKDGEVDVPQETGGERTDRYNDQGGHIVPHVCGGSNCLINIYPQAHNVNNSSEFKKDERKTKEALSQYNEVELITRFSYKGTSLRPFKIKRKHGFDKKEIEFINNNLTK
ncbi:DNA/RNA non-specific endonuclease [Myroides sp. WP-1]|uniref:DNA/RNA non-specific endonuclease n=1 Tax=Myroides sp. WP-1 TaxID=2759944 RepID=UPI0015F8FB42|nr:DNA/RNA non-specific endonuclease [Myroides sp. WP-1]MBB1137962.1 DNA/RNA non-specific endonuclease [Myroides sp. WP-1]